MRNLVPVLAVLLLAGCERQTAETSTAEKDLNVYDVREEMAPPAPAEMAERGAGIAVTAAPGVAFNYRYAFRLPGNRISATQEAHAQMCEKLGLARCRITGMRYRLENERDISAMLALKLDPAIARNFGKDAAGVVTRAEGMLVDQEISGVDAGASIAGANRSEAQIRDDLAKIEAELRRPGLSNVVRDRLLAEAADLRAQIRSLGATRDADRESLARTPMVFNYGSGNIIPGFDTSSPLREAFENAGAGFVGALAVIIELLAALLPWALLLALAWWIVRRFAPGWPRTRRHTAAPSYADEEATTLPVTP